MHLSVVIPSYNEEKRLPDTLRKTISHLSKSHFSYEIIIVDDGSEDETISKIRPQIDNKRIFLEAYRKNRGKGYAIKKGVEKANGDLILFMDSDNATPITELESLLAHIDKNQIVIGSRYIHGSDILRKQPLLRRLIGRIGNTMIQITLLPGIYDTQCGFKLFDAKVAKSLFKDLQTDRFGFDFEILSRARINKFTIKEIPVSWLHQGESRVRPIRDALKTFIDLLKIKRTIRKIDKNAQK